MSELKRCPFCGGEAKAFQHGDVGYVVQCRRCGMWNAGYHAEWSHITEDEFSGFVDEESAIAAWNARAERTCHETTIDKFFRGCDSCGWMWEVFYGIGKRERPNYCPNCGAKVVDA